MAFDPDAYLAGSAVKPPFDPDEYLAQQAPAQQPEGKSYLSRVGQNLKSEAKGVGAGVVGVAGLPMDTVVNIADLAKAGIGYPLSKITGEAPPQWTEPFDRSKIPLTTEAMMPEVLKRTEEDNPYLYAAGAGASGALVTKKLPGMEMSTANAIKYGTVAGLGSQAGADIGESIGGETGATIGSIVGGFAAPAGLAKLENARASAQAGKFSARAEDAKNQAAKLTQKTSSDGESIQTATKEQVIEAINSGDQKLIQDMIDADPNFFTALDEMGISQEPLVSYSSRNPTIRAIEQGFAARIGSKADTDHKNFMVELSNHAENLIQKYGGTKNTGELSSRFRSESMNTIDEMGRQADLMYDKIRESVNPAEPIQQNTTLDFIKQRADERRGVKYLDPVEKRIYAKIKPTLKVGEGGSIIESPATFANLDDARKLVGQAIYQKSGPFKDGEVGTLKQLYSRLSEDSDAFANNHGAGDLTLSAKAIVSQRKRLENNLKSVLGRDLSNDLMPAVTTATKGLVSGKIDDFNKTIEAIPAEYRQEVVASSLGDLFKGSGSDQNVLGTNQFVKRWQSMDDAQKDAIFKYLPKQARRDVDNLFTVSKGIDAALKDKIPTGRVLQDFPNDSIGFVRKLAGDAAGVAANAATRTATGGLVGAGDAVKQIILRTTDRGAAAADILANPRLAYAVREGVKNGVETGKIAAQNVKDAEILIAKSKEYKKWADTLSAREKVQLRSLGFISYLLTQQEQDQEDAKP